MKKKLFAIIIAFMFTVSLLTFSSCDYIFNAIFGPGSDSDGTGNSPVAHTHKMIKKNVENVICQGADTVFYWYCQECRKCFTDELGDEEILDLDALEAGHLFVIESDAETHWQQCKNCKEINGEKQSHSANKWLTNKENHYKVCNVCTAVFALSEHELINDFCEICDFTLNYAVRCNSDYGYDSFATLDNGENLQKLYSDIDGIASAFHDDETMDAGILLSEGTHYYVLDAVSFKNYNISGEQALSVWSVYRHDHPLYYWIDGRVMTNESSLQLCVVNEYAQGEKRTAQNVKLYSKIDEYLALVGEESFDYNIALGLHDAIIQNADYAYKDDGKTPETESWAHNIIGILDTGFAVCEGYAKTFQLLLNACNVNNVFVTGHSKNSGHAWNLAEIDGSWYWFDLTWDDQPTYPRGVIYEYFCKASDDFDDHTVNASSWGVNFLYALPEVSNENYKGNEFQLGAQFTADGFTYQLSGNKSLTLVSCSLSGKVEIPETVTKNGTQYKVTVIGKDAFIANKITSLYIPSSVDVIYNFAFKGCSKLTSVTFADSVGWVRKTMNNTIEEKVTLVDASDAATLLKEYYQYRQGIAVIVEHQYVWTKTSV